MTAPRTEAVHRFFRGASELAKLLLSVSFAAELLGTLLLVRGLVSERTLPHDWRPLALLSLALVILACRRYAHHLNALAHRFRRLALSAYAADKDVDPQLFAEVESDAPAISTALAKRLPADSLDEYYDPRCPPGEARLRELYVESAFFNWRLLRIQCFVATVFGTTLFITGLAFTYALVVRPPGSELPIAQVLDGFYSVMLTLVAIHALHAALSAFVSFRAMRRLHNGLFRAPLAPNDLQKELVLEYEIERGRMPAISTMLYRLNRKRLTRLWRDLRTALSCET